MDSAIDCYVKKAPINVEYCSYGKAIKYIEKYVNKCSDKASFVISDEGE